MSNKTSNIAQFLDNNNFRLNLASNRQSDADSSPVTNNRDIAMKFQHPEMLLNKNSDVHLPAIASPKKTYAVDSDEYVFPKIAYEKAFEEALRGERFQSESLKTTEKTLPGDYYKILFDKMVNENHSKNLSPNTGDTWNNIVYHPSFDTKIPTTPPSFRAQVDKFDSLLGNDFQKKLLTKPSSEKTPMLDLNNYMPKHNADSNLHARFDNPDLEYYYKLVHGRDYNRNMLKPSPETTPVVNVNNPSHSENVDSELPTKPPRKMSGLDFKTYWNSRDFKPPTRKPFPDFSYKDLNNGKFDEVLRHKWYPPSVPTYQTFDWDKFNLDRYERQYPPANMSWNHHKSGKEITSSVFLAVLLVVGCVYLFHAVCRRLTQKSPEQQATPIQELLRECPRREAHPLSVNVPLTEADAMDDDTFSVFPPSQRAAMAALHADDGDMEESVEMSVVNIDEPDGDIGATGHSRGPAPPVPYTDLPPSYEEAVSATPIDIARTPSYDEAMGNNPSQSTQPNLPSRNSPPPAYSE